MLKVQPNIRLVCIIIMDHAKHVKNTAKRHPFCTVCVLYLLRSFHHMSVTPKSLASYNLEEVPLPEGMEYFAGRAAVEAQSDFFYLFTPDVLALIQEEYDGMSFHVFRDKLYIVGQGHHDFDTVDG